MSVVEQLCECVPIVRERGRSEVTLLTKIRIPWRVADVTLVSLAHDRFRENQDHSPPTVRALSLKCRMAKRNLAA
jgi:hypothetical protein